MPLGRIENIPMLRERHRVKYFTLLDLWDKEAIYSCPGGVGVWQPKEPSSNFTSLWPGGNRTRNDEVTSLKSLSATLQKRLSRKVTPGR